MASLIEPQSSAPSPWKPRSALLGTVLANRYRITSFIGQGSTGAVFRADDVLANIPVAVRILTPALAQHAQLPRIHARIDRNKEITRLRPGALVNLVDITDAGMTLDGEIFVVTDFIDGDHLSTMLGRGGRLPWSRGGSLFIRLGQLIHALHGEGIILGTLQARHCYAVRGKSKQETIKIVNHALFERVAAGIGPHSTPEVAAQARYFAPEVACGEPVDARTDVYSFGVIIYELLTGAPPFVDANVMRLVAMHLQRAPRPPSERVPDLPAELDAALLRSLAKAPGDRFQSIAAMVEALEAVPAAAKPVVAVISASATATEIPPPSHAPAPAASPSAIPTTSPSASPTTSPSASPTTSPSASTTTSPTTAAPEVTAPARSESSIPVVRPPATPSRPVTIPPGGLRLPPPPTLGRPASGPFAPPPQLGAPLPSVPSPSAGAPLPATAKAPATAAVPEDSRATTTPVPKDSLAATTPAVPEDSRTATTPVPTDNRATTTPAVPEDSRATTTPAVPEDSRAAATTPVPEDSRTAATTPVPEDSRTTTTPVPEDSRTATTPVPKDSPAATTPVLEDSRTAATTPAPRTAAPPPPPLSPRTAAPSPPLSPRTAPPPPPHLSPRTAAPPPPQASVRPPRPRRAPARRHRCTPRWCPARSRP
jgi:serine/threonine protein kinase